ncbi:group II intron reverse transcriptase/maturase, partial [Zooshikella sp. WH53]
MSYLNNETAPIGVSVEQRNTRQETFNFDLFEAVFNSLNLQRAWKQVKANKGAPGIDGMTIAEFPQWAVIHWEQCKHDLLTGNYRPQPVKRVEIDKPDGGKRPLGIPTVIDRVIQQAIVQILSPLVDNTFSENSFGFRPKRSAHHAIKHVQKIIKQKRPVAVDVDLS